MDLGEVGAGSGYLQVELVEEEANPDMRAWMLHALAAWRGVVGQPVPGEHETAALDDLWRERDRLNAFTRALLALTAQQLGDHEKALVLVRNLENGVGRDACL